jgi:alpha-ketoglutarate-dependent taurine dioxygenase
MANSPFDLSNDTGYRAWRDAKLAAYPRSVDELIVPLADPRHLTATELAALESRCARANMAIYSAPHLPAADKSLAKELGRQLGLVRLEGNYLADEDGLSSITPAGDEGSVKGEYIPYTHKPINWHTDGYYNALDRRILGMTLHCAQDAESGGENALLDHEIAYIQLRDANPDYVAALMQPDAMTIPARMDEDNVARPEHILTARLAPGMGLICNNVLHTRSGFSDSPDRRRLLYRGRYYDRLRFDLDKAPARPQ